MDIRNSLDGLKSLIGVNPAEAPATQAKPGASTSGSAIRGDSASISSAASEISSSGSDVRMEKVAGIQAALAAGTYNVPATAVASKMIDAMLGA